MRKETYTFIGGLVIGFLIGGACVAYLIANILKQ